MSFADQDIFREKDRQRKVIYQNTLVFYEGDRAEILPIHHRYNSFCQRVYHRVGYLVEYLVQILSLSFRKFRLKYRRQNFLYHKFVIHLN